MELDTVRVEDREGFYVSVDQLANRLIVEIKALSILLVRSRMQKHERQETFADGALKALTRNYAQLAPAITGAPEGITAEQVYEVAVNAAVKEMTEGEYAGRFGDGQRG
jgi:hypothetical protein